MPGIISRLKRLTRSILAAAFGVQSRDQLNSDFGRRSPWPFVIGGLVGTLAFIAGVWALAQWVAESGL